MRSTKSTYAQHCTRILQIQKGEKMNEKPETVTDLGIAREDRACIVKRARHMIAMEHGGGVVGTD